jgi:YesN/AraC family two-component response regulator
LRADTLFFRFGITKESRYFSGFDGLIPFWRESLLRATDQFVDLAAESMILYTFSRMTAANTETDPLLARIIELSEDSFRDPAFSLAGLADELGYNVKYLSHFFKSKMKVNYTDYLRSLRINYATSLFDHGIESVKNVAMLSGFTDPLYFSTVFKNVVGCSPLAYKKNR